MNIKTTLSAVAVVALVAATMSLILHPDALAQKPAKGHLAVVPMVSLGHI